MAAPQSFAPVLPRLEISQTRRKQWTWRKRAINGQVTAGAWDSFKNKSHAVRQAKREFPVLADRVVVLNSKGKISR
jgi:hypothetical protein